MWKRDCYQCAGRSWIESAKDFAACVGGLALVNRCNHKRRRNSRGLCAILIRKIKASQKRSVIGALY